MMLFKVGDIARLRTTGIRMTVEGLDEGRIHCVWFVMDGSPAAWRGPCRAHFHLDEVELVSEHRAPTMINCEICDEAVTHASQHWKRTPSRRDGYWACHGAVGKSATAVWADAGPMMEVGSGRIQEKRQATVIRFC